MNRITHQKNLLVIWLPLLLCLAAAAQETKPNDPSPAMVGVPEAIKYGKEMVNPKFMGGGGSGYGKMFVSKEGRFKAVLRCEPERREIEIRTGDKKLKGFDFWCMQGRTMRYEVMYVDLPASIADTARLKKFYDDARDQLLSVNPSRLIGETDFSLANQTGRELSIQGDQVAVKARLLVAGKRFYQMRILGPSDKSYNFLMEHEAKALFDSFRFAPEGHEAELTTGAAASFENADFTGDSRGQYYASEYFGLRLDLPETWKPDSYGQTGASLAYKHVNVRVLFVAGKKRTEAKQPVTSFFVFGIEELANEKMDAQAYLRAAQQSLAAAGLKPKPAREIYPEKIDGVGFYALDVETEQDGQPVKNKIFARMSRGVALFFVLQSTTDEDLKALNELMHGLKLDKRVS